MEFNQEDCLACDPFEGDFGEPGDRTLKDKIIKVRKPGPCHLCDQEIKKKELARSRTDIFDGELMSFRWCSLCCEAMALSWTDNGDAYEARAALAKRD